MTVREPRAAAYSRSAAPTGPQAQARPGLAGKGAEFFFSLCNNYGIQQDSKAFWTPDAPFMQYGIRDKLQGPFLFSSLHSSQPGLVPLE